MVDLPLGSKHIGVKWVFQRKYHTNDMIQTFALLVAKGFKEGESIYYFDIYALVERISSIRIFFDLTSIHNLFVHKMDAKVEFFNGISTRMSTRKTRRFCSKGE